MVQSSRDELVRYQGVDIDPVNWGWLCDRGRFNFESVNSEERLTTPYVKDAQGNHVATTWSGALDAAARMLRTSLAESPESVAIIGGARGTNEDAFAWAQLADALGVHQRDAQLADGLPAEVFALPQATIDEAVAANTIILLSPDLKKNSPFYTCVFAMLPKSASRKWLKSLRVLLALRPVHGRACWSSQAKLHQRLVRVSTLSS